MNAAQVNQEWWKAAQAERDARTRAHQEKLAALADERARALRWSAQAFPDRVEGGHACPFAAEIALLERRRHPDRNPSRSVVERKLRARLARLGDPLDPWKQTKEEAA